MQNLGTKTNSSCNSWGTILDRKRELELFWTRSMKERMRNRSDEKIEEALV